MDNHNGVIIYLIPSENTNPWVNAIFECLELAF